MSIEKSRITWTDKKAYKFPAYPRAVSTVTNKKRINNVHANRSIKAISLKNWTKISIRKRRRKN